MEAILDNGYRRMADVARVLGISRQALTDARVKARANHNHYSRKSKLLYRLATNGSDELLAYLLDDNNFDDMQRIKGRAPLKKSADPTLPPRYRGIPTYSDRALETMVKDLALFFTLSFQHHKVVCEVVRNYLDSIGGYFCGYVLTDGVSPSQLAEIQRQFSRDITYTDGGGKIGFDFASDIESLRNNPAHLVNTLNELISIYRKLTEVDDVIKSETSSISN